MSKCLNDIPQECQKVVYVYQEKHYFSSPKDELPQTRAHSSSQSEQAVTTQRPYSLTII